MVQVLVTGDISVDRNLYVGERTYPKAHGRRGTILTSTIGGFYLLHDILQHACLPVGGKQTTTVMAGITRPETDEVASALHGYVTWKLLPKTDSRTPKERCWYVDSLLGYGSEVAQHVGTVAVAAHNKVVPDILVIDEAALGFRYQQDLWPDFLHGKRRSGRQSKPGCIVYKMAYPVMRDSLWARLSAGFSDRLTLVVAAEDLRRDEIKISLGSSWERTVQDLVFEIRHNPLLRAAGSCRHLIVTFKSEGALILSNIGRKDEIGQFVFDPAHQEGQWTSENGGEVVGYGACVTAGIVMGVAEDTGQGLEVGVQKGLSAARELRRRGHGGWSGEGAQPLPGFPYESVAGRLRETAPSQELSCVSIDTANLSDSPSWSILGEQASHDSQPLFGIARMVARKGMQVIKSIPYGRFGKLVTVDRGEIESLNSIRRQVQDYVSRQKGDKPLSIGVFGPPGAGKSFGIKQVVKAIVPDCTILEFNLSQYEIGSQTLLGLLHSVRDEVLRGRTPLVFWDEFDSRELAWLQYLLAPMQDGCFLDGQQIHPIGKCIFVFAGGTAATMKEFTPHDEAGYLVFKKKKGPDFVSRLQGYLNVLGPNGRRSAAGADDVVDRYYPVRRALLLRAMVGLHENEELQIDSGMLSALLKIGEYKHGARSLETVLRQTMMTGGTRLYRSNLPPREQIGIHVDYDSFCRLINEDSRFQAQCERLAPVIHERYSRENQGSEYAGRPYDELPPDIKESNCAAALRIPEILALAGLKLVEAEGKTGLSAKEIRARLARNLEKLAEAEHDGWMAQKLVNGWQYGKDKDELTRRHPALVSYDKLGDEDKKRDQDNVLSYPEIARMAGFAVIADSPDSD